MLIVLVKVWQVNAVAASVIGYLIGIGVNYILNYRVTFQSEQFHLIMITRFLTMMIVGLGLNVAIMHADVNRFDLYNVLAKLAAITVVLLWSYAAVYEPLAFEINLWNRLHIIRCARSKTDTGGSRQGE